MQNLLKDLLVIELASVLAGPSVGQFLAELGAEVIKIENPKTGGDITRQWKTKDEDKSSDISSYFACCNWGKNSMALDITDAESRGSLYQLIARADVVICSYKHGDDVKLKVDYESLKAINQNLIYASITGYGEDNPNVAYDAVLQAETGYMSMNGEPNSPPLKLPLPFIDMLAAHQLKQAILAALLQKEKTGVGCKVSVSLFDAAISNLSNQGTNYLFNHKSPKAIGSSHGNIVPYGTPFQTLDGRYIVLAIGTDAQFARLCKILIIDLLNYETNAKRVAKREEVNAIIQEKIKTFQSVELIEKLHTSFIPAGIVQTIGEVLESPQAQHNIFVDGDVRGIRQAIFLSEKSLSPPPHFGE
ncbi:MAG: CoA transferase [Bacteroidetes bacterium]|nr:CoA transferase [Bacteroidota bacterium]